METLSHTERDLRFERVNSFMRHHGLDALVVVGSRYAEPLDRYLSNWTPGSTVIFPLTSPPVLLATSVPEMLQIGPDTPPAELPWITDMRPGNRGAVIVAVLRERGLDKGTIGVVGMGNLRTEWEGWITFGMWSRVIKELGGCTFHEMTGQFAELLLPKTASELNDVRRAAEVCEEASHAALAAVRVGASELDVTVAIRSVLSKAGVWAPGLIVRSGPYNVTWGQPPWIFGVGSPRVLKPGDVMLAEIFAWYRGLEAQAQMAVAIPPVSTEEMECARIAREAYEAGLNRLSPGATFGELVAAMEEVVDRPGVWHLTPLVHSMNPLFCAGPTLVRAELRPNADFHKGVRGGRARGEEVQLKAGMVFELEPNACIGGRRVNIGGTVIVTDAGAEPLNDLPCAMRVAESN